MFISISSMVVPIQIIERVLYHLTPDVGTRPKQISRSTMSGARKSAARMSVELNWLRFVDLGAYLLLAGVAGKYWRNDSHHWIGAVVSVPAFLLWMLARHQIGASFAVRAEAKELVTHGLYSRIRHPIYVFGGLAFLGEFVALGWY